MTSFIYNGTVIHKRFKPKIHFFKYKVFSLLIDLSELEKLDKTIKFFSYNKFNLVSFFDFLGQAVTKFHTPSATLVLGSNKVAEPVHVTRG